MGITNYGDSLNYCCSKAIGLEDNDSRTANCTDVKYLDPMNNPPIARNECYFNDNENNKESLVENSMNEQSNNQNDDNNNSKLNAIRHTMALNVNALNDNNNNLNDTESTLFELPTPKNLSSEDECCTVNTIPIQNNMIVQESASLNLPNLNYDYEPSLHSNQTHCSGNKRKLESVQSHQNKLQTPPHKKQKFNNGHYEIRLLSQPLQVSPSVCMPPSVCNQQMIFMESNTQIHQSVIFQNDSISPIQSVRSLSQTSVISTRYPCKFMPISSAQIPRLRTSLTPKKRKRKENNNVMPIKKRKLNGSNQSMPIIIISDSEHDNESITNSDATNGQMTKIEWHKKSMAQKFQFIFHPFHIYSVSQQFIDKDKENKNKKNKVQNKEVVIPSYK